MTSILIGSGVIQPGSTTLPPETFSQISSVAADQPGAGADPWNANVTLAGTNRVLIDLGQFGGPSPISHMLDPGGADRAFTGLKPGGGHNVYLGTLLNTEMPANGTYVDRIDLSAVQSGNRQIVLVGGARQTRSFNSIIAQSANFALAITRSGGGTFPEGSRVYAMACNFNANAITASGHATNSRAGASATTFGMFCFATGILSEATATVTISFASTSWSGGDAIGIVVEPIGPDVEGGAIRTNPADNLEPAYPTVLAGDILFAHSTVHADLNAFASGAAEGWQEVGSVAVGDLANIVEHKLATGSEGGIAEIDWDGQNDTGGARVAIATIHAFDGPDVTIKNVATTNGTGATASFPAVTLGPGDIALAFLSVNAAATQTTDPSGAWAFVSTGNAGAGDGAAWFLYQALTSPGATTLALNAGNRWSLVVLALGPE